MSVIMKTCSVHGETPHAVYPNRTRCKKCQTAANKKTRQKWKLKAVEYKGSACERCGESFEGYPGVYEFHHKDPKQKDFGIGKGTSWPKIQEELDKCIMVCANCHRIIHAEE